MPSHYLNQCWNIVNRTLRNKLQWNRKRNSYTFIQENAFEDVVWKMAAILPRPQCVKSSPHGASSSDHFLQPRSPSVARDWLEFAVACIAVAASGSTLVISLDPDGYFSSRKYISKSSRSIKYIHNLTQVCSNPIANPLGLLKSCVKPSI